MKISYIGEGFLFTHLQKRGYIVRSNYKASCAYMGFSVICFPKHTLSGVRTLQLPEK